MEARRARRDAFWTAFWKIFGYQPIKLDEKSANASSIMESPRHSGEILIDIEAVAANTPKEEPRPIVAPSSVADELSSLRAAADMVADMIAAEVRSRRARPLNLPPSPPQRPQPDSEPGSPRRGSRRRSLSPGQVSNWSCETYGESLPPYDENEALLSNSEGSLVSDGMSYIPGGERYRPAGQGADDVLGDIDLKDSKDEKRDQ